MIAGAITGMMIRSKVAKEPAPQVRELSSKAASKLRKAGVNNNTFTPKLDALR
jgi:hypothetical protein